MKTRWLLAGLFIACCGCATFRNRAVATASGVPENPREAAAGPYRVQVGTDGTNESVRLTKEDETLYLKSGNTITVFAGNQPVFDYAFRSTGTLAAAYFLHIRGADGSVAFTLTDENADGVFDRKIDYGTKAVYRLVDHQWVK